MKQKELVDQIRDMCSVGGEALSLSVLCESVGAMGLPDPLIVVSGTEVQECLPLFRDSSLGGVCVVNKEGELIGIFTERDCIAKVVAAGKSLNVAVDEVMTKNPVSEEAHTTIAFALTLMSHGGFRHLPIVHEGAPIALLTVKHVIDFLVGKMMGSLIDDLELAE